MESGLATPSASSLRTLGCISSGREEGGIGQVSVLGFQIQSTIINLTHLSQNPLPGLDKENYQKRLLGLWREVRCLEKWWWWGLERAWGRD